MKIKHLIIFMSCVLLVSFSHNAFSEIQSPKSQWEHLADPELLTCKDRLILLQKNNGYPACVKPDTYLKLVDRGFTKTDFSLIHNRPQMLDSLMQTLLTHQTLMDHWHDMMIKNPTMMNLAMSEWVVNMKKNPQLLENLLEPMTNDPILRKRMIESMKQHSIMESSLKQNPTWMNSVHMHKESGMAVGHDSCTWCADISKPISTSDSVKFSNPEKIMELLHHLWINDQMRTNMHSHMLENPEHLGIMSQKILEFMLNPVMDDPDLRELMIDLLLQHQGFMNSIRHESTD